MGKSSLLKITSYLLTVILGLYVLESTAFAHARRNLVAKLPDRARAKNTPSPLASSKIVAETTKILNLRIHPSHLVKMIHDEEVLGSARMDLDFILGPRVTLGPSVLFEATSKWDEEALANGKRIPRDEMSLEVGLVSNIYLTGTATRGGFILRPHLYGMEMDGERADESGVIPATQSQLGLRGGVEFVYQLMDLTGFNLEVGGGLTYHFISPALEYPEGGVQRVESEKRLIPTITAGAAWAF